jgi:MraZ protein
VDRLLGSYRFAVDSKGRISIPAPFRRILFPQPGLSGTLTRGLDNCVALYPPDRWEEEVRQATDLPFTVGNVRLFAREMAFHAKPCTVDSQGRIILPKELRDWARIDKVALVLGVFSHIEIFNPEVYEAYRSGSGMTYERAAEELYKLRAGSRPNDAG